MDPHHVSCDQFPFFKIESNGIPVDTAFEDAAPLVGSAANSVPTSSLKILFHLEMVLADTELWGRTG